MLLAVRRRSGSQIRGLLMMHGGRRADGRRGDLSRSASVMRHLHVHEQVINTACELACEKDGATDYRRLAPPVVEARLGSAATASAFASASGAAFAVLAPSPPLVHASRCSGLTKAYAQALGVVRRLGHSTPAKGE